MNALTLENVTKVYGSGDTAVTALANASFAVAPGELVAIVGPSGSGKTTMLAIIGALLQPTEGRVVLDGIDVAALAPAALAAFRLERIGFVFQAANLVPFLTVRDQLLLVAKLTGDRQPDTAARADRLLAALGLGDRLDHYPEQLSGGQRQRVAIARALMNDPRVILADEPTASLDWRRGREVIALLADEIHARNKVGILVTHDERLLDLCDRVVRMTDGQIHDAIVPSAVHDAA
ncbi:MAG TPA: ABC transporter ATP-binding protein [Thermomicrobiales bacterium]